MAEKKTKEEKLSDFERKGNHWLELTRNWILEANQAKNLILSENFLEIKNFLKTIGSNRRLAAGKLAIDFKNPWNYLAEMLAEARGEAPNEAANSIWWTQGESNPPLPLLLKRESPQCAHFGFYSGRNHLTFLPAHGG